MKSNYLSLLLLLVLAVNGHGQPQPSDFENVEHPQNIILMIGDGMGVDHFFAGMVANHNSLNIERFTNIGFQKTQSASSFITDSGASGTAMATGEKTYNHAIGVDMDKQPLKNIREFAEEKGLATGVVATSSITHATPAAFVSHQESRKMYEAIAMDFVKSDIEVFIGGGNKYFDDRKDGKQLSQVLESKGFQVVYTLDELQKAKSPKLAGMLADKHLPRKTEGRGEMLMQSSLKAIELLKQDEDGFFLMIEASQIDWGGHDKDIDYIIEETLDFDNVVGAVLDFAEKNPNTLVIVTADHETGGLGINGGDFKTGKVNAGFTTGEHTGVMVPVFAYGPCADKFRGIYENTGIFTRMFSCLGLEVEE